MKLLKAPNNPLPLSALGWLFLNILMAALLDLNGDEAYYWMFGQHLDWGFFDHPPAIALLAKISGGLPGNHLWFRMPAVVLSAATHLILGKVVLERGWSINQFIIAWWCLPLLHLFGFVMTPDAPLLFALACFIWIIHKHDQGSNRVLLFLPFVLAGVVYSKYQGVVVLVLALLPWKGFWNWKFLGATLASVMLFLPHLAWQFANDWVTFKYHLVDRTSGWAASNTPNYIFGQLLVFHPYLLSRWAFASKKPNGDVILSMGKWVIFGLLGFFLIMSFRGAVEPHWTAGAALFLPLGISAMKWKMDWRMMWVFATMLFLGVFHAYFIVNPTLEGPFGNRARMQHWNNIAKAKKVLFMNSYGDASLYRFYTDGEAQSYNNMYGRKNQYDLWQLDADWSGSDLFLVSNYYMGTFQETKFLGKPFTFNEYDDLTLWNKFHVQLDDSISLPAGEEFAVEARTINMSIGDLYCPETEYPFIQFAWKNSENEWELSHVELALLDACPPSMEYQNNALRGQLPADITAEYGYVVMSHPGLPPAICSDPIRISASPMQQ